MLIIRSKFHIFDNVSSPRPLPPGKFFLLFSEKTFCLSITIFSCIFFNILMFYFYSIIFIFTKFFIQLPFANVTDLCFPLYILWQMTSWCFPSIIYLNQKANHISSSFSKIELIFHCSSQIADLSVIAFARTHSSCNTDSARSEHQIPNLHHLGFHT